MLRFNYITKILVCGLLFLQFAFFVNAQEGKNPFDLEHRLQEKSKEKTDTSKENPFDISKSNEPVQTTQNSVSTNEKSENPFDISNQEENPETPQEPQSTTVNSNNPFDKNATPETSSTGEENLSITAAPPKEQTKQKEEASGFVFWTILLMMIFLALEITLFKSLINKVYRAFTNDNILKLLHREQRDIIAIPYLLLYIFFFINFGIFLFLAFYNFGFVPKKLSILLYCIGGVGLLFLLKHILLKIVEIIFPVQKEIKQYSFSLVIFSSILGFTLVPFNIVVAFASSGIAEIALYGGLLTIFGITLFCILRGLFLASKYLSFHKFHFFMYLCTVEIAPVLVVVKLLLLKAGIH